MYALHVLKNHIKERNSPSLYFKYNFVARNVNLFEFVIYFLEHLV